MDTVESQITAVSPDENGSQPTPQEDSTRKHIRGSSLLLAGRIISLGLNFAVQVLTVRYLSKSDYGAFAYALSVMSMGASIALFGLDKAIARYVPIYQEQKEYGKMFGTILMTVGAILGIGISLILLVFGLRGLLMQSFVNDPLSLAVLLIVIALAPIQALDNWFEGMLAIFASPRAIFFRRHVLGPGLKLGIVLLVIFTQHNVYLLAVGYVVGGILGQIVYTIMLFKVMHHQGILPLFNWKKVDLPAREVFGFSVPLLTTDLALILRTNLIVILLEYFRGTNDVAAFRAVLPVAGLNLVVLQSFKYLFTPLAARLFARDDRIGINDLYWRTAIWISVISFPIFAITFSMARPLTLLLFGEQYAESAVILALLSFGSYFNAALGFNSYTLRVYGKVRYIVIIDLLTAILAVGLNLWLIPRFGALGAAVGTTVMLVTHNLLSHVGLLMGTGIDLFQVRYLRVYGSIFLAALTLLIIDILVDPSIFVNATLVAIVSLLLLRVNQHVMDIGQMFPELKRIPFLRPFLGL